jgi:hypothetical protein
VNQPSTAIPGVVPVHLYDVTTGQIACGEVEAASRTVFPDYATCTACIEATHKRQLKEAHGGDDHDRAGKDQKS